jgi:hypothetical protein
MALVSGCKTSTTNESSANSNNKTAVAKPTPHTWEYKQNLGPKMDEGWFAVAFSPDSSLLGIVGSNPASIWDVQSKKLKQMLKTDEGATL